MNCCCQNSSASSCQQTVNCRPFYPMQTSPCPTQTVVYLRPNCPPCCPMPCPPKAVITTYPRPASAPRARESNKQCYVCTAKKIPVLPPPPPTPPITSPNRPYVAPC